MIYSYISVFIKEKKGYSVIFPNLDNLATFGKTLDNAYLMAIDCVAGYIHWLKEDGEENPRPYCKNITNDIDEEKIKKEYEITNEEFFTAVLYVDVEEYAKEYFQNRNISFRKIQKWITDKKIILCNVMSSNLEN